MRRFHRFTSLAVLLALSGALAGCGAGGMSNFDPSDLLDFLDSKKKLPGERKPVFPEGVPGLQPGVPKELYRGAQAEPDAPPIAAPEAPAKGRKTAATKSRAPVQVAPSDANVSTEEGEPAAVPAAPAEAKPKVARKRTTAPPPDPEPAPAAAAPARPAQTAPAQTASPFPAPLPSGTFSR